MEENFRIIYRILRTLERAMDLDEFDFDTLSAEKLGISRARWAHILRMLVDAGYIQGVRVSKDAGSFVYVDAPDPAITLYGLEFLNDNSTMQRFMKAAKGIKEIVPGI